MAVTSALLKMRIPIRTIPGCYLDRLPYDDIRGFFSILESAPRIERHADLLLWLQGDMQAFLPHQILIAAWGDFTRGPIYFDAVSPIPYARTAQLDDERTRLLLRGLFDRWLDNGRAPYAMPVAAGLLGLQPDSAVPCPWAALAEAGTVLVHGIKDQRGRYDCLYVLFGAEELAAEPALEVLCLLLPYLDAAQRQVLHLPEQYPPAGQAAEAVPTAGGDHGLSPREVEIMDWVGRGKTNLEIGMILDISAFTVKNHLRRIFRKLDVINRAQAVARVKPLADAGLRR
ncbi:MAG: LuxR family transcriptional regulator [Rhodocyclaceae bacterium]|nr:MAG: LuxR family transcriptional regulator [Rhodocyclaceae bacterium]TNC97263.1 MAG: LuxR family transcriptional regulator [Rhodocyclaceae bacterium]